MRKILFFFAASVMVSSVVGCASNADSGNAGESPVDTADDPGDPDQTLRELGVDPTAEQIAVDFDDDSAGPDVEDPAQFPAQLADDDDDLEDQITDDDSGLASASLGSGDLVLTNGSSGGLSAASLNPSWWNQRYACSDPRGSSCVCRGSMYNCQFPNKQPGRNRLLTQAQMDALAMTKGADARKKIVDEADWAVSGNPKLYDGDGIARGDVSSSHVHINYGQDKTITEQGTSAKIPCLYAFNVELKGGAHVSGWIPASAVNAHAAVKAVDAPSGALTGTKMSFRQASDYSSGGKACAAATFDPSKCLPAYAELKVVPKSTDSHEKMGDYLLKEGNVINIIYSTPRLGGAATDTLIMRPELTFERVKSTKDHATILRIHLYKAKSTKDAGVVDFLYGKVAGKYGWVAAKALKKFTAAASPDPTMSGGLCGGKGDGALYCDPSAPTQAFSCTVDGNFTRIDACDATSHCVTDPMTGKAQVDGSGTVVCAAN